MGRWRIGRIRNFSYPCRICGKKHESAYMADICAQLDLKLMEQEKKKLIPINEFINKNKV